jgi:hypothetical protein
VVVVVVAAVALVMLVFVGSSSGNIGNIISSNNNCNSAKSYNDRLKHFGSSYRIITSVPACSKKKVS